MIYVNTNWFSQGLCRANRRLHKDVEEPKNCPLIYCFGKYFAEIMARGAHRAPKSLSQWPLGLGTLRLPGAALK